MLASAKTRQTSRPRTARRTARRHVRRAVRIALPIQDAKHHHFRGRTTFTGDESDAGVIHSGVPSVATCATAAPFCHCLSDGKAGSGTLHPVTVGLHGTVTVASP